MREIAAWWQPAMLTRWKMRLRCMTTIITTMRMSESCCSAMPACGILLLQ